MFSVIVAFPKQQDAANIKNILVRSGIEVAGICTTGAQTIAFANEQDGGIVITAYRLPDMHFKELNGYLPQSFQMLLIASAARLAECIDDNVMALSVPIKTKEMLGTIQMMQHTYVRRKRKERETGKGRSSDEQEILLRAKTLLMERNNMSEEEAHRYIQKSSMDSGTNMAELAAMILSMM